MSELERLQSEKVKILQENFWNREKVFFKLFDDIIKVQEDIKKIVDRCVELDEEFSKSEVQIKELNLQIIGEK